MHCGGNEQAPPLPLDQVVVLECVVVDARQLIAWATLVRHWSLLRWGGAMGNVPRDLRMRACSLFV